MTVLASEGTLRREQAPWAGIAAGLAAGALWGMVFVVPRMTVGLSVVDVTAGRFVSFGVIAAMVMALRWRNHTRPTWRQAITAFGMSTLGATGYYLLLAQAINASGSEVPTLIIGTIPVWVMVLGKPLSLQWRALLPGLMLTVMGLVLMTQGALKQSLDLPQAGAGFWWGVVLASGAMSSWTAFALLNAAWLKRHPEVSATEWTNWLGVATGVGAVLLWLCAGSDINHLLTLDNKAWIATVCIVTGLGAGWAASILWNLASQRLSVSLCGQLIVSETLFALFYSFAWDGVWPTGVQWLATVLFTLGIVVSVRAHL